MNFDRHAGMNLVYREVPLSVFLSAQRSMGVQSIEFWAGFPHFSLESAKQSDRKELHSRIRSYGLKTIAVTAPSLGYQYQYCPVSIEMARKCRTYFQNALYLAAELEAPIMTVNSGWSYFDQPAEIGFHHSAELLFELCIVAKGLGIKLALESLTPLESNLATTICSTQALLNLIDHDNLGLTIDTGACACSGETSQIWFQHFQDRILHSHFIDGKEQSVGHLIWGTGSLNIHSELAAYEANHYSGYFSSELASGLYGKDPVAADKKNVSVLKTVMEQ